MPSSSLAYIFPLRMITLTPSTNNKGESSTTHKDLIKIKLKGIG